MNKIWKHQIACLFVLAVVHNHLSSSSFCVFRIGGVLVFVKDQGLSRVFGFSFLWVFLSFLFRRFWVSLFDGWLYWFFVSERRGGLCCVRGVFLSLLFAFWGVSPLSCIPPFLIFSLVLAHSLTRTHTYTHTHLHEHILTQNSIPLYHWYHALRKKNKFTQHTLLFLFRDFSGFVSLINCFPSPLLIISSSKFSSRSSFSSPAFLRLDVGQLHSVSRVGGNHSLRSLSPKCDSLGASDEPLQSETGSRFDFEIKRSSGEDDTAACAQNYGHPGWGGWWRNV